MRVAKQIATGVASFVAATAARLCLDRRGSIAVFLGLAIVPLVGVIGIGVDTARGFLVRSRLSQALDAAALAGGRVMFENYRDQDVAMYFTSNFPNGYLGATVGTPTITDDGATKEYLTVTAQATLPSTFMRIFGQDTITVKASATINRVNRGMELALVLDNTYSMATNSKMNSLKTAANSLLDILFGNDDTANKLYVGIVPFVTMVNIGEARSGWTTARPTTAYSVTSLTRGSTKVNTSGSTNVYQACVTTSASIVDIINDGQLVDVAGATQSYYNGRVVARRSSWPSTCTSGNNKFWYLVDNGTGTPTTPATGTITVRRPPEAFAAGTGYSMTNGKWKGCVEQRFDPRNATGYDASDPYDLTKADDPPTTRPFFKAFDPSTVGVKAYNNSNKTLTFTCTSSSSGTGGSGNCENNWATGVINENGPTNTASTNRGPNKGCAVPVQGLQPSKAAAKTVIASMQPWAGGGTNISTGLSWGWRLLSPNYRGLWGSPTAAELPLDYNTALVDKVVVLLSDGANVILEGEFPGCDGSNDAGGCAPQDSQYTGYGKLTAKGYNSTTLTGALTQSNNRVTTLCNAMKAKGIIMYTIMLEEPDPEITAIFQGCATKPEYYFEATSGNLNSVFQKIANQLSNLRLSQ